MGTHGMTKLGPLVDLVVVGEPITHFPHFQIGEMEFYLDCVNIYAYFEFIDIVDDKYPYLVL